MNIIEFENTNIENWVNENLGKLGTEHLYYTVENSTRTADLNFYEIVTTAHLDASLAYRNATRHNDDGPLDAVMLAIENLQFKLFNEQHELLHDCAPFGVASFQTFNLGTLNHFPLDKLFRYHVRAQVYTDSILRKVQSHLLDHLENSIDTIHLLKGFIEEWKSQSIVETMKEEPGEVYRLFEIIKALKSIQTIFNKIPEEFSLDSDPFNLEFC